MLIISFSSSAIDEQEDEDAMEMYETVI
ncbi:hypothetical protein A2U01_0037180, partial [Trifolium medium]|nr:hypothetical protein [Trifolium medium]